jgi:RNA polymerase sigma-70 factor, ECF subfamily
MYAIAYRCALRFRRTRARRRTRPLRDSELSKIGASIRATSRAFFCTDEDRRLDALRSTLSDEEQTLLVMRLDRNMSWQEVVEVLGTAPSGVPALRKRYQRLKERLRQAAAREGLVSRRQRESDLSHSDRR